MTISSLPLSLFWDFGSVFMAKGGVRSMCVHGRFEFVQECSVLDNVCLNH